jgi:hypothetical protein
MNPGYGMPHSPQPVLFATSLGGDPGAAAAGYSAGLGGDPYGTHALFATAASPAAAAAAYSGLGYGAAGGLGGGREDVRTIFVSGLPHDIKERELHNLLRFMPGYEASQMNWKTGGPQGFALFSTAAHARAVVDTLSGLQFDDGVVLRAEIAHKDMYLKVRRRLWCARGGLCMRMNHVLAARVAAAWWRRLGSSSSSSGSSSVEGCGGGTCGVCMGSIMPCTAAHGPCCIAMRCAAHACMCVVRVVAVARAQQLAPRAW